MWGPRSGPHQNVTCREGVREAEYMRHTTGGACPLQRCHLWRGIEGIKLTEPQHGLQRSCMSIQVVYCLRAMLLSFVSHRNLAPDFYILSL